MNYRTIDVDRPPDTIIIKKAKSRVVWVKLIKPLGGKTSISIEYNPDNNTQNICVDSPTSRSRRIIEILVTAGSIAAIIAILAALIGYDVKWVVMLGIAISIIQAVYDSMGKAKRDEKVIREGCPTPPGPLLKLIVEDTLNDARRILSSPLKKRVATIAGLPYKASAYKGRLGLIITYKRLDKPTSIDEQ